MGDRLPKGPPAFVARCSGTAWGLGSRHDSVVPPQREPVVVGCVRVKGPGSSSRRRPAAGRARHAIHTASPPRAAIALGTWRKDSGNPLIAGPRAGAALSAFPDPFVWREDGAAAWSSAPACRTAAAPCWPTPRRSCSPGNRRGRAPCRGGRDRDLADLGVPAVFRRGDQRVLLMSVWEGEPSRAVALVGSEPAGGSQSVEPCGSITAPTATRLRPWSTRAGAAGVGVGGTRPRGGAPVSRRRAHASARPISRLGRDAVDRSRPGAPEAPPGARVPRVMWCSACSRLAREAPRFEVPRHHRSRICGIDRPPGSPITWQRGGDGDRPAPPRPGARGRSLVREPRSIVRGGLLPLARDEPLRLHLYVDRSLVEVYANERLTTTERAHPTRQDSTGIVIDATGGAAQLLQLRISRWALPRRSRRAHGQLTSRRRRPAGASGSTGRRSAGRRRRTEGSGAGVA
jgi:hypothetical protein